MHVCWGRLSFGVSVRACSQELNPTKSARIGDSVGNRADIHCSTASSSEVFQGLYGTNACPECFDSFWPSSVSTAGRGGSGEWLLIQSSPRPPIVHKPDKVGGHAVVHGEWQATGPPHPRSPIHTPPPTPPWPSSHPNFHPPKWWISLSQRCFHNKSVTVRIMQTDSYSLAECAIREG